jgi:hypothetical protein
LPLNDPDDLLHCVADEDDYLDALICALVARAAELGLTYEPKPGVESELAEVEGWIHLPDAKLGGLVA